MSKKFFVTIILGFSKSPMYLVTLLKGKVNWLKIIEMNDTVNVLICRNIHKPKASNLTSEVFISEKH